MKVATPRRALALLALVAGFSLVPTGLAAAAPAIGKDGKIRACYRVKGKPKGAMRVVKGKKARCRKGERKVAWVAAGAVGSAGAPGSHGIAGQAGPAASTGAFEAKVAALTARLENLEAVLGDVCAQTAAVTTQLNALAAAVGGTALGGVIPLGLVLTIPALPSALPDYACP